MTAPFEAADEIKRRYRTKAVLDYLVGREIVEFR
jgi:hypothetical protein